MYRKLGVMVVTGWLLGEVGTSLGYSLDQVKVEWWTGSGVNRVLLVVDFWPYNEDADSFAFGYRFNASQITGLQLLDAVAAAGQGFSYSQTYGFVTDIWYVKDGQVYHTGYNWPLSYWSYWLSEDWGESWEYSGVGAGQRILFDGDTDGWLALPGDDYTSQPVTPLLPEVLTGDVNCDGLVDFHDINPFVVLIVSPAAWQAAYPDCPMLNGDINLDGSVNFGDINPFVTLITGP